MNELGRRVAAIETKSLERLDELRRELQAHVGTELAAAEADHRAARIAGTVALAIGLVLATTANFVSYYSGTVNIRRGW